MDAAKPADDAASATPDPRDRRSGRDRRAGTKPPAGVERRQGDRREAVTPDAYRAGARHMNEYPLLPDEMEFINAINAYKHKHSRPFPTWSEVLHVVKALGYRKSDGAS